MKRLALEFGMGTDLRGADYTKAAVRALKDALWHNALSVYDALGFEARQMHVEVVIGVARPEAVDAAAVAAVLPYGTSEVKVERGGLDVPKDDGGAPTVIANAVAIVYLDVAAN
ncbi:MAG: Lin0512 family protein [Lautropia sp.]